MFKLIYAQSKFIMMDLLWLSAVIFYARGVRMKKYFLSLFALPIFCFAQEEPINPALLGLGQAFFFDKSLSYNKTQSCSTCHMPAAAFADLRENDIDKMVSQGDDPTKFGNRNTPTAIYAKDSPDFKKEK